MLAYIPDQHWYIAAFFQSRTFQHLSGGGIWEFAKHVERVLHASLECQLHKSTFTSFRGPTDCRALWWSCASFFVATEKGKTRILGLKKHTLFAISHNIKIFEVPFFFFSFFPFFVFVPVLAQLFCFCDKFSSYILTQGFFSTPKIFWPYIQWIFE